MTADEYKALKSGKKSAAIHKSGSATPARVAAAGREVEKNLEFWEYERNEIRFQDGNESYLLLIFKRKK